MIPTKALVLLVAAIAPVLGYFPVKGPVDGTVQPRLEINTLIRDADQWNIFLLAMQKFQASPDSAVDGYYAISGIHGVPQAWDDSPRVQPRANSGAGYCFHTSQQFFLWHRPYMSVFEQALVKHAVDIAATFKDPAAKARYQKAASTLRLPYWDWASNSAVPQPIQDEFIQVNDPVRGRQRIKNPMFSYTFKDANRNPTGSPTTTRSSGYNQKMIGRGTELKSWVSTLFNTPNICWNVFASNSRSENAACAPGTTNQLLVSLEAIHNDIHINICGSMCSFLPAAFDPIFWLHHSNVDRIGALWQAINYKTFVPATPNRVSTFAQSAPGTLDANSPFYPFHSADNANAWWTANGVRDPKSLLYTYPELQGGLTGDALAKSVQAKVNAMYGVGRTLQGLSTNSRKARRAATPLAPRAEPASLVVPPTLEQLEPYKDILVANNGSFPDYLARVALVRKSVPIGFSLKLFFGSVEEKNRVGSIAMLSSESMPERTIEADIPVTDALLNKLVSREIASLKLDAVKKFATNNLKWKVEGGDGVDYSSGVDVTIDVVRSDVLPNKGAELPPVVAPAQPVANVTDTAR